jgi:hypothetical protein
MLYSFMIIVVAWLWKPSKDSQRYGYMQGKTLSSFLSVIHLFFC